MKSISVRSRRVIVLLGLFVVSFALYMAAKSGSESVEIVLLGLLAVLMAVTIRVG